MQTPESEPTSPLGRLVGELIQTGALMALLIDDMVSSIPPPWVGDDPAPAVLERRLAEALENTDADGPAPEQLQSLTEALTWVRDRIEADVLSLDPGAPPDPPACELTSEYDLHPGHAAGPGSGVETWAIPRRPRRPL